MPKGGGFVFVEPLLIHIDKIIPHLPLGLIDVFDDTGEYTGTLPPGTPWPVVVSHDGQMLGLTASVLGHTVVKYVPSAAN